jgi:hypothetical protein
MHGTETQCKTPVVHCVSVSTVTTVWVGGAGVRFSPGAREYSLIGNVQTDSGADTAPCIIDTG